MALEGTVQEGLSWDGDGMMMGIFHDFPHIKWMIPGGSHHLGPPHIFEKNWPWRWVEPRFLGLDWSRKDATAGGQIQVGEPQVGTKELGGTGGKEEENQVLMLLRMVECPLVFAYWIWIHLVRWWSPQLLVGHSWPSQFSILSQFLGGYTVYAKPQFLSHRDCMNSRVLACCEFNSNGFIFHSIPGTLW